MPRPVAPDSRPETLARSWPREMLAETEPFRANLTVHVEVLRAAVAGSAVLDDDGIAIGPVAGSLLGDLLHAPVAVEAVRLGLGLRRKKAGCREGRAQPGHRLRIERSRNL